MVFLHERKALLYSAVRTERAVVCKKTLFESGRKQPTEHAVSCERSRGLLCLLKGLGGAQQCGAQLDRFEFVVTEVLGA